jgi:hypothetical protein
VKQGGGATRFSRARPWGSARKVGKFGRRCDLGISQRRRKCARSLVRIFLICILAFLFALWKSARCCLWPELDPTGPRTFRPGSSMTKRFKQAFIMHILAIAAQSGRRVFPPVGVSRPSCPRASRTTVLRRRHWCSECRRSNIILGHLSRAFFRSLLPLGRPCMAGFCAHLWAGARGSFRWLGGFTVTVKSVGRLTPNREKVSSV